MSHCKVLQDFPKSSITPLNKLKFTLCFKCVLTECLYWLFSDETSAQMKPCFVRKKATWVATSPSWTDCKSQLQILTLLAVSHGCRACTAVALYGQSLSSFVCSLWQLMILRCSVSCAWCLSDFCGVCSNLAPFSCSFSSVSRQCFLPGFLSEVTQSSWLS
jgi:hypothetical protein